MAETVEGFAGFRDSTLLPVPPKPFTEVMAAFAVGLDQFRKQPALLFAGKVNEPKFNKVGMYGNGTDSSLVLEFLVSVVIDVKARDAVRVLYVLCS